MDRSIAPKKKKGGEREARESLHACQREAACMKNFTAFLAQKKLAAFCRCFEKNDPSHHSHFFLASNGPFPKTHSEDVQIAHRFGLI